MVSSALSPVHTGDYSRRIKRRLSTSPKSRDKLLSPNSATIVASVDRALRYATKCTGFLCKAAEILKDVMLYSGG